MKYSVILRVEETDPCFALYSRFSDVIVENGHKLLLAICDKEPVHDGFYLEMTMTDPEGNEGVAIRIPQHYVALIGGDWVSRTMGFRKK